MKTHQLINQLLTCVSVVIKQRHLPEVAEVVKQAAVLVNAVRTTAQEKIDEELQELVKNFEAKMVAGGDVTAQDLVMEVAEPAVAEEEDFTPLPDEVDEEVAEATLDIPDPTKKPVIEDHVADAELEEEDFLADLDEELNDA